MSDTVETVILKEVEKRIMSMFADGVNVENVTSDVEAAEWTAKALATHDPILRAGYLEKADEARGREH